ncbi:MAG: Zn-dependent hydrolase, partial [Bacteroidetes bacterium]|nr:Zn-dependent hydrolase [Bacteroidota bacterium]
PIAVTVFTNEEGARFQPDMLGSLVYVGGLGVEDALSTPSIDGPIFGDELMRIGYAGTHPCPAPAPHAFVELHIEQGPVLESLGRDVGIVTGVQGLSWFEVTVEGASNHAGTTPMDMRRDAGAMAGTLAAKLRELPALIEDLRLTIGSMHWHPNLVNVIPDRVVLTIDVRHPLPDALAMAEERIKAILGTGTGDLEVSWRSLARVNPCRFTPRVVEAVASAAKRNGLSGHRLISGAGHDAHILSRCYDAGMIFIPSRGGISHHPDEFSTDEHIRHGTQVLLDTVLTLAGHPDPTP